MTGGTTGQEGRPATLGTIPSMGYVAALDGVRAIAVTFVVLFHARLPGMGNGGIGVDMFFVLSGFLITTLLLEEVGRSGRIRFGRFYARRAARLLPAYLLVVVLCLLVELVIRQGGTFRGAATSFLYASNWSQVLAPQAGLGMLAHTWTLSIEEQFYVLWPASLLFLSLRLRTLRRVGWAVVALIALFAVEVALIAASDSSLGYRLVNGTDTRAPVLLTGALLAVVLAARRQRGQLHVRWGRWPLQVVAVAALLALVAVAGHRTTTLAGEVGVQWPLVALATVVLILAAVSPEGLVARALAVGPMVLLGKISYGLYLWHFPVFFVVDVKLGLDSPGPVLVAVVVSLALSALSYRYLEMPVRAAVAARTASRRTPEPELPGPAPLPAAIDAGEGR